ncbi:MAG TPA: polysaccharide export protein EpsE [Azonexus sp.]|nr:polysaccharide export protein EpsE [Azonexus sp.]
MKPYLRKFTHWLATLACLGCLGLSGPLLAADDTLGPGDSIRVTVFENPDLTTEARISANGFIRFPLLGNVKLDGLSSVAAGERIAQLLKDGNFIRDPQVNVALVQVRSRQVSVLGQVTRPGRYALDETSTTVTDMLALAGGIAPTGDDVVTLVRQRNGNTERRDIDLVQMYRSGDMTANLEVENGDTVFVRRAPMFYIYGEVQRAGSYRLESDMTVMQALSLGGGVTVRGTERGIRIARRNADGVLARSEVQLGDHVQPNDIIQVRESLF